MLLLNRLSVTLKLGVSHTPLQSTPIRSLHTTTTSKGFPTSVHLHSHSQFQTRLILRQYFSRRTKATSARKKLIAKNDALILANAEKHKHVPESLFSILGSTPVDKSTESIVTTGGFDTDSTATTTAVVPKKRGRPLGSKNKKNNTNPQSSTSTAHPASEQVILTKLPGSMGKNKTGRKKYYAVRVGAKVGVFGTWEQTQPLVNGFRGAKYKSFPTQTQAEAYVRGDDNGGGVTASAAKESASAVAAVAAAAAAAQAWATESTAAVSHPIIKSKKRKAPATSSTVIDAISVLDASYSKPPQPPVKKAKVTTKKPSWKGTSNNLPVNALQIFTDGSCLVNNGTTPAGWGAVCVRPMEEADKVNKLDWDSEDEDKETGGVNIWQICGPVVTKPNRPDYIFAEKTSNNTGELCAIIHALKHVLNSKDDDNKPVIIRADSKYAMKSILGLFATMAANHKLIKYGQSILEKVRETRVVEFEHVKAHNSHKWNDLADELANKGRCMPQ